MTSLIDFLEARLAEDWEIAFEASQDGDAGNTWAVGAHNDREARIGDDRDDLVFDMKAGVCIDLASAVEHVTRHHPRRVLREVEAKRAIIAEHSTPHTVVDGFCTECGGFLPDGIHQRDRSYCEIHGWRECETLLQLAAPYSDHPDYNPEWSTT